jgi:hypothetical protein
MIQLNSRRHRDSIFSALDCKISSNESQANISKWTIVRQRLPDILALNPTYQPTHIRAQLMHLLVLMRKETVHLRRSNVNISSNNLLKRVMINIDGRQRYINLKYIPSEQMIHIDMEDLTFSIPTRQLIIAISRGHAHETAAKYCPPAIRDMLIDLSKSKVIYDGQQYQRAMFKTRLGQGFYVGLLIVFIGMILLLILSTSHTLWIFNSLNSSILLVSRTESTHFRRKNDTYIHLHEGYCLCTP